MNIIPYKQSLTHSCLAACFLMLLSDQSSFRFTEEDEQQIALNGSKRVYPLYVVGIPNEVAKKYGIKIHVYINNKFFTNVLQKAFIKNNAIEVSYAPVTLTLIKNLLKLSPLICHIDDHALGDFSHASHFIILEKATDNSVFIVDPWSGQRKRISDKTLNEAILDLKIQVKMCPLLFSVEK